MLNLTKTEVLLSCLNYTRGRQEDTHPRPHSIFQIIVGTYWTCSIVIWSSLTLSADKSQFYNILVGIRPPAAFGVQPPEMLANNKNLY